jgi:hypothetical protein
MSNEMTAKPTEAEIDAFLAKANTVTTDGRGRLIFAMDATMSRQPTWDLASDCRPRCSAP